MTSPTNGFRQARGRGGRRSHAGCRHDCPRAGGSRLHGLPSGDDGSGTVMLLGLVCVAVLLSAFLGLLASAQSARARAQSAADLGAIAGASRLLPLGGGDPCAIAAQAVSRNGGRLAACEDQGGGVVRVRVVVPTTVGPATAEARAGPASVRD